MSVSYPSKLLDIVFAVSAAGGLVNNIPDTVAVGSALASYKYGFQAVTMTPVSASGIPPQGQDFNGIYQDITSHIVWINAGGQYRFSAALSTLIGGYPAGMVLQNNAGTASYISTTAANTTDFNSTPSSIGTLWLPYSRGPASEYAFGLTTTGGTTALTLANLNAGVLVISGALTTNAVLTIPTGTVGRWVVENKTTGSFTLTMLTVGGTGATIKQGVADTVYSDGTNANYPQSSSVTATAGDNTTAVATTAFVTQAVADVGGYYVDSGAVNAMVITTVPPTIAYANGITFRVKVKLTNTAANPTLNAGAGAVIILREDQGAVQPGDLPVGSLITVTYDSTLARWLLTGPVFSQFGTAAFRNVSDTFTGSGISGTQAFAGNPNGFVAGNAAVAGTSPPSTCWDTTDGVLFTCTVTGNAATAVWVTPALATASSSAVLYQLGYAM